MNDLVLKARYGKKQPLKELPGDVESNPDNYLNRQLRNEGLRPMKIKVYKGMDICLTQNIRKDLDFVNGMIASVEAYDEETNGLRVKTVTGHRFAVWPWTDNAHGNVTYYPIRYGYAGTIPKYQGAELNHVTIFLDVPNVPAAAYTAMTRVATRQQYLIGGRVSAEHFTPAK